MIKLLNLIIFTVIPILFLFNLTYASSIEKTFSLIINENIVEISPDNVIHPGGIKYHAMTFNNTIPGPPIVADEGDTVRISVTNKGTTISSIIFKAGLGPSQALTGNIEPGKEK